MPLRSRANPILTLREMRTKSAAWESTLQVHKMGICTTGFSAALLLQNSLTDLKDITLDHQWHLVRSLHHEYLLKPSQASSLMIPGAHGQPTGSLHPLHPCCTPPPANVPIDVSPRTRNQVPFCSELPPVNRSDPIPMPRSASKSGASASEPPTNSHQDSDRIAK